MWASIGIFLYGLRTQKPPQTRLKLKYWFNMEKECSKTAFQLKKYIAKKSISCMSYKIERTGYFPFNTYIAFMSNISVEYKLYCGSNRSVLLKAIFSVP